MRKTFYLILLLALLVIPARSQRGTGTMSGTFFDPFPIGAQWKMADALTGYVTNFEVNALSPQTSYSCFTPAYSSMMVDISIAKTNQTTYPSPGLPQNEDLYVYKSASWGPFIFMQINSNMLTFLPINTEYFFQAFASPPYGMMLQNSESFWNQQVDSGLTNTCKTPPATLNLVWKTVNSVENRTTPVYSGPVNCALYNSTGTPQTQEKWCFAADPRNRFPTILVELDTVIEGGLTSTIKLQTASITKF